MYWRDGRRAREPELYVRAQVAESLVGIAAPRDESECDSAVHRRDELTEPRGNAVPQDPRRPTRNVGTRAGVCQPTSSLQKPDKSGRKSKPQSDTQWASSITSRPHSLSRQHQAYRQCAPSNTREARTRTGTHEAGLS